jgi:hypothetical protein
MRTGVARLARRTLRALGALLLATAAPLAAQQVRLRARTALRYLELRPIRHDTASGAFVAEPTASALPLTQDVEVSVWGLGAPGLRAYGLARGRAALGSDLIWPRTGDHLDVLAAFVEWDRPQWRLRAGRQSRASALGWSVFDGALATWRPAETWRAEVFAGRALARGFLEPAGSDAIRALDPLRPDEPVLALGAAAWAAPTGWVSLAASWQREILADRSGLVSERAAVDADVAMHSALHIQASADADLAAGAIGRARLGAQHRLGRRATVRLALFRYRPVFDLTTIWGVFAPEAHHGLEAGARVSLHPAAAAHAALQVRRYRPVDETTPFLAGVADHATSLSAGLDWTRGPWAVAASYQLTTGFGGAHSGADVSATMDSGRWRASVRATAFQEDQELRVADGTVVGLGAALAAALSPRLAIRADLARYWHRRQEGTAGLDWGQTRAGLSLEWSGGANADLAPRR